SILGNLVDGACSGFKVQDSSNVRKLKEEFLRDFKRFDTVENFSDHHYASMGNWLKQNWVKKVQEEWKILDKDLPEAIFVRACESRMDLLRAVIIGAEGTPYHDGLFFFDIQFPDTYPSVPPKVYYHSGGLRINPNLYNCGKVCLSLLGTWTGTMRENWLPKESTMLQLLVSIQALILNEKPYFNEPFYARTKGTPSGESQSRVYSENVFVLSLKTMVYSMRKPPQHFEEFVRCHFFVRSHDIVKACNAYKDGAPVGSMVKGGVQGLDEQASRSGSKKFRTDVASFMKTLDSSSVRKLKEEFLRDFKRFDTVEDFSDHHYGAEGSPAKYSLWPLNFKGRSKNWGKTVQEEWKILDKNLPETIFVRACESRMDLLRAVIIGAEGTPYHDGLFFFDIQFPDTYPSVPPKVHYHSGGLRINPNLYKCGKVCLSLIRTWTGKTREKWLPKESTMLQLLVSIQALILNEKPYFNEPGYEKTIGTPSGESNSKAYSENVFVLSLKTMHFEEFVRSHFFVRQSGSKKFRTNVASYMKTVVDEFVNLGAIREANHIGEPNPTLFPVFYYLELEGKKLFVVF
ncbi:unnamed protein product, partial [Arabidopsis halleri]